MEIEMEVAAALLIFSPAVISILYALYSVVRWMMSRRHESVANHLLVGLMGPLALLAPRLMGDKSRYYFTRFLLAFCFFIAYCGFLMVLFK